MDVVIETYCVFFAIRKRKTKERKEERLYV